MTIYDKICLMSEEQMADFLYRFQKDTINAFSNFVTPNKERIIELLETELDDN